MDQRGTVEFLSSGRAFGTDAPVEVVETHGAYVFLCGDAAFKLKRAVRYDYMDLSTADLRHKMLVRELELNQPFAPEIYRDILPVTQSPGGLMLGGTGQVVDWVLRMWRFPAENELERIAERGAFDDRLADDTGVAIAAYHAAAPTRDHSGRRLIAEILAELGRVFAEFPSADGAARVPEWQTAAAGALEQVGPLLDARGRDGHVRRAHGDLHLRNLVLIDGRPVPFDALEFDETLGTCDVLYDIAFLVMDLCHRDLHRQACRVLDAWLREARGAEDAGLAALPLFLSVRAAIRAMVLLQTDAARQSTGSSTAEIAAYLDLACAALRPAQPRLIALGGFSGSGKSVLARALAAGIGALPGAVILNSDQERKAGRAQTRHLDPKSYGRESREAVYRAILNRAETILSAGHSVILDATFVDPALRASAEEAALRAGVPFHGLWIDVPDDLLADRVMARRGDVSDADRSVLDAQLRAGHGPMSWTRVDGTGAVDDVRARALDLIGRDAPDRD
ncbi:AAA family ATPase [Ponticoccus sp. SC2-23]|uniref:bifunctional aminoglycoside phosphotransferase/ATP-binding protein n=1 Tax=Alexandriicola marinus TaxID=2081710 RepID=UPI000FD93A7D|nr:bifunctional aminoglycoside phosphotransferase/ATP-binding protein [Alexandriicola marinus]MBM1218706.1 AAA family ATPase [Ponticoccus sp. SC6-9]MBM1224222.1 AAA family ATPase [Ponticoccus sp. SC6-15]MBM1229999.1 AAA family ATPase [Ponticoccus sp. SC6-38]MBM1233188.1 AAA family ATPase [Ponticoccus sp. SC6-45]MBM1236862.1 AAA family ATPase [Ponticoccus sp. SC6-49]MBM1242199.1 AAA family ATPase [Ponticoccus sp. SC2-64]MBM1246712.1 AAA family ATPase [Ponticoccus sp. SC6-42]MBM1251190.1 AAA 